MYAVTSIWLVSRTRATLRSAEFGFFGVVVYTRVQTPRRWGEPFRAGVLVLSILSCRPLRTNCWIVGMRPAISLVCVSALRLGGTRWDLAKRGASSFPCCCVVASPGFRASLPAHRSPRSGVSHNPQNSPTVPRRAALVSPCHLALITDQN